MCCLIIHVAALRAPLHILHPCTGASRDCRATQGAYQLSRPSLTQQARKAAETVLGSGREAVRLRVTSSADAAEVGEPVLPDRGDGGQHSLIVDDDHGDDHEKGHCKDHDGAPLQRPHQPVACCLQPCSFYQHLRQRTSVPMLRDLSYMTILTF